MTDTERREATPRTDLVWREHPNTKITDQRYLESCTLERETIALRAELEAVRGQAPMSGHEAACYYCGKPCNSLAANPGQWPIPLCHEDEPGKVKWHHTGCVSERLKARSAERSQGGVWVPREPTESMIMAICDAHPFRKDALQISVEEAVDIYKAMLSSAPQPAGGSDETQG